jgi:ANTAR domain
VAVADPRADGRMTAGQADDLAQAGIRDFVEAALPLFGVDGAAVVLHQDHWLGRVVASDAASLAFAQAQLTLGEGPCLDAIGQEPVVHTEDLRADPRWLRLGPAALAHGVRGVLTVRVEARGRPAAAFSLTTATPRRWSDSEVGDGLIAASVLGRLLQAGDAAHAMAGLAEQLQRALDSRTVIEQAKGVLIERQDVSAEAAFELLRTAARASRRRLVDVAAEVLAERATHADRPPSRRPGPGGSGR